MQTARLDRREPAARAVVPVAREDALDIAASCDLGASLQAWRARGIGAFDAIECRTIEAMLRRAALLGDRARGIVEAKARQRLGALIARFDRSADRGFEEAEGSEGGAGGGAGVVTATATASSEPACAPADRVSRADDGRRWPSRGVEPRSALAALLAHVASQQALFGSLTPTPTSTLAPRTPTASALPELKTLSYFQATWATLSADRRLRQSLSALPENAGPLNSQRLVHRALQAMRELSPAYLEHFIAHVDTLLWLDDASGGLPLAGKAVIHAEADKVGKPEKKRTRR